MNNASMRMADRRVCPANGLAAVLLIAASMAAEIRASTYDPLTLTHTPLPPSVDLTAHDSARGRDVPVRVYLPASNAPAPVVLFSHGLGGSRTGSAFLGRHWAARGYVAVFLQHPGSDESVWSLQPMTARRSAMQQAASLQNFLLRLQDVPTVLNQLEAWNTEETHPLVKRLDLKAVGMSGHSFGALTTQAVSGQWLPVSDQRFVDARIRAAIAFSPSTPRRGNAARAFGSVRIPWLLMTGTKDLSPIGEVDLAARLGVYPALRGAPKYEVVLHHAEHSAFTERALPGDREPRNPNHHRVILALSTAFWDAYLRHDRPARDWLHSPAARSVMAAEDTWQFQAP